MKLPFHLGLRKNHHTVTVIKLPGRQPAVLGTAQPDDDDRRARILANWGVYAPSPRQTGEATINQPLPVRSQTLLYYQVNPTVQTTLDGGVTPLVQSRRDNQSGPQQRVHLGTDPVALPTDGRPGRLTPSPNDTASATPGERAGHGTISVTIGSPRRK